MRLKCPRSHTMAAVSSGGSKPLGAAASLGEGQEVHPRSHKLGGGVT